MARSTSQLSTALITLRTRLTRTRIRRLTLMMHGKVHLVWFSNSCALTLRKSINSTGITSSIRRFTHVKLQWNLLTRQLPTEKWAVSLMMRPKAKSMQDKSECTTSRSLSILTQIQECLSTWLRHSTRIFSRASLRSWPQSSHTRNKKKSTTTSSASIPQPKPGNHTNSTSLMRVRSYVLTHPSLTHGAACDRASTSHWPSGTSSITFLMWHRILAASIPQSWASFQS